MASLIPENQKESLNKVFNDLHDTWKRDIYLYKVGKLTVISSDPNYSSIYASPKPNKSQIEDSRVTIQARILYDKKQIINPIGGDNKELKLELSEGGVRIKIDINDKNHFDNVKKIELDGTLYSIDTNKRLHGLFNPNFFTLYLKKEN